MVKPPLRTKSIGFKVSEEEYAQLETAAQTSGRTLGEWCRELVLASGHETKPTGPGGAEAQALMAELLSGEHEAACTCLFTRQLVQARRLEARCYLGRQQAERTSIVVCPGAPRIRTDRQRADRNRNLLVGHHPCARTFGIAGPSGLCLD